LAAGAAISVWRVARFPSCGYMDQNRAKTALLFPVCREDSAIDLLNLLFVPVTREFVAARRVVLAVIPVTRESAGA
jgi:hypothetical protein